MNKLPISEHEHRRYLTKSRSNDVGTSLTGPCICIRASIEEPKQLGIYLVNMKIYYILPSQEVVT